MQSNGRKNMKASRCIIPFRLFNKDYLKANNLTNLQTLCPSCHRRKEGELQKNEQYNM